VASNTVPCVFTGRDSPRFDGGGPGVCEAGGVASNAIPCVFTGRDSPRFDKGKGRSGEPRLHYNTILIFTGRDSPKG
jgi:hypothetical protein